MPIHRTRETGETRVEVTLDPYGGGECKAHTGVWLLDEILRTLAFAAGWDLEVVAKGDLDCGEHHTVEDVGITLGQAIPEGEGWGSSIVPSGESWATAAVSLGEPGFVGEISWRGRELEGMDLAMVDHFLRALAYNGRFTLHLSAEGGNDRRKVDASMKAVGSALGEAYGRWGRTKEGRGA